MIATEKGRLTAADYRQLPPDDWRYQLIDGEIVMAPAPNFFHQTIGFNIVLMLGQYLADHPLGHLRYAPLDVYLDDTNVFQPDVLFISHEREAMISADGLHGAPDLIVEILSPHTSRYDQHAKRAAYARAGVRELWLVFPEAKRVAIFRFGESAEAPVASCSLGETFHSPLFPELEISTDKIFAR